MQARRLAALRGGQWIIDGFALYRRNPPLITLLSLNYWLFVLLIAVLPFVGPLAATVLQQALLVTVMNGCRAVDEQRKVAMDVVWSGFRSNLPALLRLGGLYLVGEMVVLAILFGILGFEPLVAATSTEAGSAGLAVNWDAVSRFLQGALPLLLPLMLAFWFAPMLAAWHGLPARKALFFSAVAVLRNWRAFVVYGAAALLLTAVLPAVLRLLFAFSETLLTLGSAAITMALVFVIMPTLFASVYMSFRDVFAGDEMVADGE